LSADNSPANNSPADNLPPSQVRLVRCSKSYFITLGKLSADKLSVDKLV
jgi:hypothetical protein